MAPCDALVTRFLLVFLGSGLGGGLRLLVAAGVHERIGTGFPLGTLVVNLIGSFALGGLFGVRDRTLLLGPDAWFFLGTGLCGGFTTMSTFSLETAALLRDRELLYATGNVLLSLIGCVAATGLGFAAVRLLTALPR